MATGNIKVTSKFCKQCDKQTKVERNGMIMGCGDLIMVCCTFGLWLIFRVIYNAILNPWCCKECGSKL